MTTDSLPLSPPPSSPLPLDWSLLPASERVLVAVSGGADSQALLLALHTVGHPIVAAHINHGIRGAEADYDEAFVLEHCKKQGIPAVSLRLGLAGNASEDEARQARYAALKQLARENHCTRIGTGHTATDSLETTLINLLRGAAVEGLAGIRPQRELEPGLWLVRPMHRLARATVHAHLAEAGWAHVEDSSNATDDYLRNRLRHRVLPELLALVPGGEERVAAQAARAGALLRDDIECLDTLAREHLSALAIRREPGLLTFAAAGWLQLPVALQRRVLREAVQIVRASKQQPSSGTDSAIGNSARPWLPATVEQIETVRRQVHANGRRAVWCWPGGLRVEWTGDMAGNRVRLWLV